MKYTNIALGIIAVGLVTAAVKTMAFMAPTSGTAVITIPANDGKSVGGGTTMVLPEKVTSKQGELLAMAYKIAAKDGHKYPQILQGLLLQETHAGALKSYRVAGQEFGLKSNERYYGLAQIKLAAAKDVIQAYPKLRDRFEFHTNTDEEIIANLILNDRYNLEVASKYLLILGSRYKIPPDKLLNAYNQGPGGAYNANGAAYAASARQHIANLARKTSYKQ